MSASSIPHSSDGAALTKLSHLWPVTAPASSQSLNNFLSRARARILPPSKPCAPHIFIGNEGADLDSIASAIVLAYASESNGAVIDSVPIINCMRADFHLRGDAYAVLSAAGIDPASLVFIDDADILALDGSVTLVDHNEPASHQHALASRVRGIIDHHVDAGKHLDAKPRVVDMIGSSSTIVCELWPGIIAGDDRNDTAALLLMCAILVDTRNMTGGSPRDASAIKAIRESLKIDEALQNEIFRELYERKADQSMLTTTDLLRRDYKRFEGGGKLMGISSSGLSFSQWAARDMGERHVLTAAVLKEWAQEQAIDVLIVMTLYGSVDNLSRELLVCPSAADNAPLAQYVLRRGLAPCVIGTRGKFSVLTFAPLPYLPLLPSERCLSNALNSDDLDLHPMIVSSLSSSDIAVFRQGNILRSRKRVAPIVLKCLAKE